MIIIVILFFVRNGNPIKEHHFKKYLNETFCPHYRQNSNFPPFWKFSGLSGSHSPDDANGWHNNLKFRFNK